jgi:hypothetical protein
MGLAADHARSEKGVSGPSVTAGAKYSDDTGNAESSKRIAAGDSKWGKLRT